MDSNVIFNFLSAIGVLLGAIGVLFGIWSFSRTQSARHRLKIEVKTFIDESHSFLSTIQEAENDTNHLSVSVIKSLSRRYESLNHSLTVHLLSLDKKLSKEWIKKQPEDKKADWEHNLQVKTK